MKSLTLKQLRKAIDAIKNSTNMGLYIEQLEAAERFLTGATNEVPFDPREVLTTIGYKW